MANPKKMVAQNVPGDFFVDTTCINCDTCRQKKEKKCESCEAPKRCGISVKNFFVHSVGGTIGNGLKQVPCKFEGAYNSTADAVTPKPGCGCK